VTRISARHATTEEAQALKLAPGAVVLVSDAVDVDIAGVPIHAMLGDSHAALFGHGIRAPGPVKATFGTGSSLMTLTEQPLTSRHGLSTTIAWNRGSKVSYALEGNIIVSGQALAFAARLLSLSGPSALADLAATVPDSGGAYFVPALAGLGAPHWDAAARGLFCGLSHATTPAHLARAALEAVALQVSDVFRAMESDLGAPLSGLSADGGASANDRLMQLQADVLGRPVLRADRSEQSACGAGAMAGIAAGIMDEASLSAAAGQGATTFRPVMPEAVRSRLREGWAASVARARLQTNVPEDLASHA
jgi:glycerol kinase